MSNLKGQELTSLQQSFIEHYVADGGDVYQAAKKAGYAESGARANGHKMLRNPLIQKQIQKLTLETINGYAPKAVAVVMHLARNARSEYVQLQAAQDILDRAGFKPPERVDHRVDAALTVSLNLSHSPKIVEHQGGGSELPLSTHVTLPHKNKSSKKLDAKTDSDLSITDIPVFSPPKDE